MTQLTDFQLMILKAVAASIHPIVSLHHAASGSPGWRKAASRGALTSNARRAVCKMADMGLATYHPPEDRWDVGGVGLTPAGRKFLDALGGEKPCL